MIRFMLRIYSSIEKIRAELAWMNETPDPNKCGCRNRRCCEETVPGGIEPDTSGYFVHLAKQERTSEVVQPRPDMIPFEGHLRRIIALHLDQISGTDMEPPPHTMCRCANEINTVIISISTAVAGPKAESAKRARVSDRKPSRGLAASTPPDSFDMH
jgi:hypothetical protein